VVAENINTHPKKDYWKLQGAGVSKNKMFKEKPWYWEVGGGSTRKNPPWERRMSMEHDQMT